MYSLDEYLKLSNTDNQYLEHYLVYRDIYNKAKINNVELTKDEVVDLRETIMDCFNDYDNVKLSSITSFIADNYLNKNITLEQLKQCDEYEIICAMDNDDITELTDRFKDDEMER